MFDIVVNYYHRPGYPALVQSSAKLALSCYRFDRQVSSVWLVDGSAEPDEDFCLWCQQNGIQYLHDGHSLTFSQAFNLGARHCQSDWIALSASDIYIPNGFFEQVQACLKNINNKPIGCLVPALSSCDIPSQERCAARVRKVGMMSINLNLFPAYVLRAIGGIPENYSGGYNDVDICLQLKRRNLEIYQLPILVLHYGKLTINQGSDYAFKADQSQFFESHPELFCPKSLCNLKLDKFQRGWKRLLFQLERSIPLGRFRNPVQKWLWKQFG
jgi:GT2 family glycosyltransferase